MYKPIIRSLAPLAVALMTVSCFATMGKMQKLDDTLRVYEGAIRWSEFELANSLGAQQQSAPDLTRLQTIRVTGYQVKHSDVSEDAREAQQTVLIQYYDTQTMRQETIVHNQQWHYDEEKQRWLVQPNLPSF